MKAACLSPTPKPPIGPSPGALIKRRVPAQLVRRSGTRRTSPPPPLPPALASVGISGEVSSSGRGKPSRPRTGSEQEPELPLTRCAAHSYPNGFARSPTGPGDDDDDEDDDDGE